MNPQEVIVGIDEAGRGALAGPVVAGACVLTVELPRRDRPFRQWMLPGEIAIADSKKLEPQEREAAFAWITAHCMFGIGIAEATAVDRCGILGATEQAMHAALEQVSRHCTPTYLLIDGHDHFWFDIPKSGVVHGDALEPAIAAASILAKVTRDRLMTDFAEQFPRYGFAEHKGYGTEVHISALKQFGPCPIHRRTFLTQIPVAPEPPLTPLPPHPVSRATSREAVPSGKSGS